MTGVPRWQPSFAGPRMQYRCEQRRLLPDADSPPQFPTPQARSSTRGQMDARRRPLRHSSPDAMNPDDRSAGPAARAKGLDRVGSCAQWLVVLHRQTSSRRSLRGGIAASESRRKAREAEPRSRRRSASVASTSRHLVSRAWSQVREPRCEAPPSVTKTA